MRLFYNKKVFKMLRHPKFRVQKTSISIVRFRLYLLSVALNLKNISRYDSHNWIHILDEQVMIFKISEFILKNNSS
jgi:hypothetical protein